MRFLLWILNLPCISYDWHNISFDKERHQDAQADIAKECERGESAHYQRFLIENPDQASRRTSNAKEAHANRNR